MSGIKRPEAGVCVRVCVVRASVRDSATQPEAWMWSEAADWRSSVLSAAECRLDVRARMRVRVRQEG